MSDDPYFLSHRRYFVDFQFFHCKITRITGDPKISSFSLPKTPISQPEIPPKDRVLVSSYLPCL